MKLLLDINVVLDAVLERRPWAPEAALLLSAIERNDIRGCLASHSVTTIFYVVRREVSRRAAIAAVTNTLALVDVQPVDAADFRTALSLGMPDFEDAVQVAAAIRARVDYLVTRNAKDFRGSPVPLRSPAEVLALM